MVIVTDAYERVTTALQTHTGYRAKEGADWKCPAHSDGTASLSVNRGHKGCVLHCHAGCSPDDVLKELGLVKSDLFDVPLEKPERSVIEATYDYHDADGTVVFQVVRYRPKTFKQRRPDGTGSYLWNMDGIQRVPFHLPQLRAAVSEGVTVFVTEGEKDVLSLEALGYVATTNPGGAGKWANEYSEHFVGADVVVIADKDDSGRIHARRVRDSLVGVAEQVRVVEALKGKDVTEHLALGYEVEELVLVDDSVLEEPTELITAEELQVITDEVMRPFRRISIDLSVAPAPPTILVRGIYGDGRLTVLQSEPGVGKSWLATWIAQQVMDAGASVIYIDEEGGPDIIHERLSALGADPDVVAERFFYFAFESRRWDEEDLLALDELIARVGDAALVVLDSLPDFLAAASLNEDSAQDVTTFVSRVLARFRRAGITQLLLDHLPKPQTSGGKKAQSRYSRGSGAKLAKADATLLLEATQEFDVNTNGRLHIWKTKDRRGRLDLPTLGKSGLVIEVETGGGKVSFTTVSEIEKPSWDGPTACMEAVLDTLKANPGHQYSARKLADAMKARGHGFRDQTIREAAARLANDGLISHGRGSRDADLYSWSSVSNHQNQEAF